jgi:hypothetical protein
MLHLGGLPSCNDAPEGLSLTLFPETQSTLHGLVLDVHVSDPDEQAVSLDIQRTRDGEAAPETAKGGPGA